MITQENIPYTTDEIKAMVKTIEELRKKYNGALERAKYALTTDMDNSGHWAVNYIFPELKESEDELIRKAIKSGIKHLETQLGYDAIDGVDILDIYSWLEKQGEQPTDKVEPKFHEGDYIVPNDITFLETWRVINIDKNGYYNIRCITNPEYDEIYCIPAFVFEKEYHLWTIADAKCGDVLVASDGSLFILSKVVDTAAFHYFSLCKNGNKEISDGNRAWESVRGCHPATKEERELLYAEMKESGWEWDSEKKKLKNL